MNRKISSINRGAGLLVAFAILAGLFQMVAAPKASAAVYATYRTTDDIGRRNAPTTKPNGQYGIPKGASFGVECQVIGEPHGNYGNKLYFLTNYNGMTYVPDAWTDSPHLAKDPPIAGIPMCGGSASPQPTQGGATIFYAGDNSNGNDGYNAAKPHVARAMKLGEWAPGNCRYTEADTPGTVIGGRKVTNLAGFSIGRLGPIYALKDNATLRSQVRNVVIFDPGNYQTLDTSCDRKVDVTGVLEAWLRSNSDNRLTILAGNWTGENRHKGIQEIWFAGKIRNNLGKQVAVCNVGGGHTGFMDKYASSNVNGSRTCPGGVKPWSP